MERSTSIPLQGRDTLVVHLFVSRGRSANQGSRAGTRVRKTRRRKPGKACNVVWQAQSGPTGLHVVREIFREFIGGIPKIYEPQSDDPAHSSSVIIKAAAIKAAALSGGLALPPGPLGILTIIPDLLGIWKIHNQMVADVAWAYGRKARLSQKQMMRCLFKHAACQLARDVIVRVVERALARRASLCLLQRIGVPILGAAAVAAYTYFDTLQVGKRAIVLFGQQSKDEEKPKPRPRRKPSLIHVNGAQTRAARLRSGLSTNGNGARKAKTSSRLLNCAAQAPSSLS